MRLTAEPVNEKAAAVVSEFAALRKPAILRAMNPKFEITSASEQDGYVHARLTEETEDVEFSVTKGSTLDGFRVCGDADRDFHGGDNGACRFKLETAADIKYFSGRAGDIVELACPT